MIKIPAGLTGIMLVQARDTRGKVDVTELEELEIDHI
jgi:hypothetical protein